MNTYLFQWQRPSAVVATDIDGKMSVTPAKGFTAPTSNDLKGLGIGILFGSELVSEPVHSVPAVAVSGDDVNFVTGYEVGGASSSSGYTVSRIVVRTTFSLDQYVGSNVNKVAFNTRFSSTNEYSDKPYPVKGLLAVAYCTGDKTGSVETNFDNYQRWLIGTTAGSDSTQHWLYVGIVNASKTDFFTPLADAAVSVVFEIPGGVTSIGGQQVPNIVVRNEGFVPIATVADATRARV